MFVRNGLFTSESVSEGHPDKLADRISDRVLDAFLERPIYFLTAALGRSDLALPWETQGRTGTPGRNQEARP